MEMWFKVLEIQHVRTLHQHVIRSVIMTQSLSKASVLMLLLLSYRVQRKHLMV